MISRPFRRVCAIGIPGTDPMLRKPRLVVTKTSHKGTARALYAKAMNVPFDYVVTYPCKSRMGWVAMKFPQICEEPEMRRMMKTIDPED